MSFASAKRKDSWILAQEKIVSKLLNTSERFESTWELWAKYMKILLYG